MALEICGDAQWIEGDKKTGEGKGRIFCGDVGRTNTKRSI